MITCARCHKQTSSHTMSIFNTDEICLSCKAIERKHPRYKEAQEAEAAAVKRGDYNFEGIGWPEP